MHNLAPIDEDVDVPTRKFVTDLIVNEVTVANDEPTDGSEIWVDWDDDSYTPSLVPTGAVTVFAGAAAPAGWLLCDGAAVSRTTYAALFAVVGTIYGVGDGSTTFNLPSFKGRVPAGVDAGQPEFDAAGKVGGAKTHTLTQAEMPSHSHPLSQTYVTAGGVGVAAITYATTASSTGPAGSGGAHNNLQPYLTMNYIVKT